MKVGNRNIVATSKKVLVVALVVVLHVGLGDAATVFWTATYVL